MRRRMLSLAAVALLTATLAGCVPAEGPLAVRPMSDSQKDALLEGTVRITDGCVWVEAADAVYIPVFAVGDAHMDGDALDFGAEFRDGDAVQIGGGVAALPGDDWYIPAGCPDAELWAAAPPFQA